jgi:membrane protein insertase Oxa1/YidC/SpoIIIJ
MHNSIRNVQKETKEGKLTMVIALQILIAMYLAVGVIIQLDFVSRMIQEGVWFKHLSIVGKVFFIWLIISGIVFWLPKLIIATRKGSNIEKEEEDDIPELTFD